MARADLLLSVVRASRRGDEGQVRRAVEALAAAERAKRHTVLADRLLEQLRAGNGRGARPATLPPRAAAPSQALRWGKPCRSAASKT